MGTRRILFMTNKRKQCTKQMTKVAKDKEARQRDVERRKNREEKELNKLLQAVDKEARRRTKV